MAITIIQRQQPVRAIVEILPGMYADRMRERWRSRNWATGHARHKIWLRGKQRLHCLRRIVRHRDSISPCACGAIIFPAVNSERLVLMPVIERYATDNADHRQERQHRQSPFLLQESYPRHI